MRDVTDIHEEFGGERLPPGQRRTERFPVLQKGDRPAVDRSSWRLQVWGAVESSATYDFEAFTDLPTETQRQDFHCVTGWSRFDNAFTGVPFPALAERVGLDDDAVHVMFHAAKWVTGIEVLTEPERGYWERRGYSDSADPWREERYA